MQEMMKMIQPQSSSPQVESAIKSAFDAMTIKMNDQSSIIRDLENKLRYQDIELKALAEKPGERRGNDNASKPVHGMIPLFHHPWLYVCTCVL